MPVLGVWLAEWSRKHPSGGPASVQAGAMTMSGTGLLIHEIERDLEACSCRWGERARGLVTLPSSRPPQRRVRVGGLHVSEQVVRAGQELALAMVAIFFPRRFAMAV